jgi:hypothetical protein
MRLTLVAPLTAALALGGQFSFAQTDATDLTAPLRRAATDESPASRLDGPGLTAKVGVDSLGASAGHERLFPIFSFSGKRLEESRRNSLALLLVAAMAESLERADAGVHDWSVQERAEQEQPTGRVMTALTQTGSVAFLLPAVGLSLGEGNVRRASAQAARAELATGVFVETLKRLTHRSRPEGGKFSFPSGHAAAAFAEATAIASYYPRLRVPLYAWATGVAASRVYLGRHYLTDVVVGSSLGIWVARKVHKNNSWPLEIRW